MPFTAQAKKLSNKLNRDSSINYRLINLDKDISVDLIQETLRVHYRLRSVASSRAGHVGNIRRLIQEGRFSEREFIANAFRVAGVNFVVEQDDEEDDEEDDEPTIEEQNESLLILGLSPEGIYD